MGNKEFTTYVNPLSIKRNRFHHNTAFPEVWEKSPVGAGPCACPSSAEAIRSPGTATLPVETP